MRSWRRARPFWDRRVAVSRRAGRSWRRAASFRRLAAGLLLGLLWSLHQPGGARGQGAAGLLLTLEPPEAVPGAVVLVAAAPSAGCLTVDGSAQGRDLAFWPRGDGIGFAALLGIDLDAHPGVDSVRAMSECASGERVSAAIALPIAPREFPVQDLTLPVRPGEESPEVQARIAREEALLDSLWQVRTPQRLWEGPFTGPLDFLHQTTDFGLRRIVNGAPRKPHTGVDLRAASGTTVRAIAAGRVAFTGELYFAGRTVILDHGQGLYSMYFHLSRPLVSMGQLVSRGQPMGRSGATGRATGPHLHWGVRLAGARVDPMALLSLPLGERAEVDPP